MFAIPQIPEDDLADAFNHIIKKTNENNSFFLTENEKALFATQPEFVSLFLIPNPRIN